MSGRRRPSLVTLQGRWYGGSAQMALISTTPALAHVCEEGRLENENLPRLTKKVIAEVRFWNQEHPVEEHKMFLVEDFVWVTAIHGERRKNSMSGWWCGACESHTVGESRTDCLLCRSMIQEWVVFPADDWLRALKKRSRER